MEAGHMARVTGIGGIFFRSSDPESLYQWYERHLGITRQPDGSVLFRWGESGETAWAIFPQDTPYFGPSGQSFMINFRVDDLDTLLSTMESAGVEIDPNREEFPYGKFAWIVDPDGNRIELWEPPLVGVQLP
jgi:predicted enzyme related to lactoylglutathione lyase